MSTTSPLTPAAATGPSPGLPRRFLRAFLLLVLARDGELHGYELCECVRGHGLVVDLGGVYRDLRTMERHDLVTSTWEPSDSGPDRRVYQLTAAGRAAAAAAVSELELVRDGLSDALDSLAPTIERGRP